jgi:hypothetical protein
MRVKLAREGQELYVLAQSEDRRKKENAIRRRKLKALVHGLSRLKRTCRDRDRLIGKVAVLRKEAGRATRFLRLRKPRADEPVNRQTFVCTFDRAAGRRRVGKRVGAPWRGRGVGCGRTGCQAENVRVDGNLGKIGNRARPFCVIIGQKFRLCLIRPGGMGYSLGGDAARLQFS